MLGTLDEGWSRMSRVKPSWVGLHGFVFRFRIDLFQARLRRGGNRLLVQLIVLRRRGRDGECGCGGGSQCDRRSRMSQARQCKARKTIALRNAAVNKQDAATQEISLIAWR